MKYNDFVGIYAIKPKFQQVLKPIENVLVDWRIHPTIINLFGLFVSLITAFAIYLSPDYPWLLLFVPFATSTRTACNALDGLVSRRLKVDDSFGEVLNEFIDRVSDSIIFGSLILLASVNSGLAVITLIIILLNSYLSILSKAAGASRQYGGFMGKADRMIYISIASVIVFFSGNQNIWNYFLMFILVGTVLTLVQRFLTTKKELSQK